MKFRMNPAFNYYAMNDDNIQDVICGHHNRHRHNHHQLKCEKKHEIPFQFFFQKRKCKILHEKRDTEKQKNISTFVDWMVSG